MGEIAAAFAWEGGGAATPLSMIMQIWAVYDVNYVTKLLKYDQGCNFWPIGNVRENDRFGCAMKREGGNKNGKILKICPN